MSELSKTLNRPPASRQTSVEYAHGAIVEAICSGQLAPGRKLVISGLAESLGLSITPIREALRQLQHQGLVTDAPYSGMRVAGLSTHELWELFSVRGLLEGHAVARATTQVTPMHLAAARDPLEQMDACLAAGDGKAFREQNRRFHQIFIEVGTQGDGILNDFIHRVQLNTQRYATAAGFVLDLDDLRTAQDEHRQLLELVSEGRADEAEALSRQHALTFAGRLARALPSTA